ncbi:hypothetical protein RHS01_07108 [Rhizoctonia solani]|uniref:Uncharacterized protein n=1 Tax=Rhizoctonia solani TaxID=456999 RepID=A0A8H7I881_9AGAM|nr:hypothetical protein RHS01_07108 [Rhizoctonia solani]
MSPLSVQHVWAFGESSGPKLNGYGKAPITTSYNLLKKYSEGELTLHSSAVVALVKRIALEAARWFDLRYAHDRGHVVMVLVKLFPGPRCISFDPVRRVIAVAPTSFTLDIHELSGWDDRTSAESRMRRAQPQVIGVWNTWLLKNPRSYAFDGEQVAEIGALLRMTSKTDTNSVSLPFLPPSFNLDDHLVKTILGCLALSLGGKQCVNELARTELFKILTLPSHLWAHNEECYRVITGILPHIQTVELKLGCLIAIGSQWIHTPVTLLLGVLFRQGIFQTFIGIMSSNRPVLIPMAMVQLRNMVI